MMSSTLTRRAVRGPRAIVGLVAVVGLSAAACTTSQTGSDDNSDEPAAKKGDVKIFVIGGKSDDPFWSKVKRGVDDAAVVVKKQGGSVTFLGPQNYDNLGPDAAKLIDSTLSQNASVVVAPDWVPEAQDDALKRVVAKGVPLFVYNAGGIESADKVGALNFVGTDDYKAGVAGGEFLGAAGPSKVLCVNTLPGTTFSESRCQGLADGIKSKGGTSEQLSLPASNFGNKTAVAQAIKAALIKDTSIDGVVTIGVTDADTAVSALEQGGLADKVKLGTFDTDDTSLQRVKDGTMLFAVDQQPYMQGYLAVTMASTYVQYGIELPQRPLLTGPAVISEDNVDAALAGAKAGIR